MNKNKIIKYHAVTILSDCLLTILDELENANSFSEEFKDALKIVRDSTSKLVDESFKAKSVSKSNYIADMSHKVFTTIRKNFKTM